jgi:hypothetical protein
LLSKKLNTTFAPYDQPPEGSYAHQYFKDKDIEYYAYLNKENTGGDVYWVRVQSRAIDDSGWTESHVKECRGDNSDASCNSMDVAIVLEQQLE